MLKGGRSKDWKVEDTSYFQLYGKLIKPCGNMVFPMSFHRYKLIGNPYIFRSVGLGGIAILVAGISCSKISRYYYYFIVVFVGD